MTLKELKKSYRRNGVTLRNEKLNHTFEIKGVTKISNIQQGKNFTKAVFTTGKYIVEITAWKPEY